jgi:hypothetical protein
MTADTLEARLAFGPSIRQFETLDVDPENFDHEAHLYVAWQYLTEVELLAAIDRYRSVLRRLVVKLGAPEKYHETITWLYMIAVAERRQVRPGDDWPSFKAANADLFERGGAFIRRYYSAGAIDSPVARNHFVLPDRQGPASSV